MNCQPVDGGGNREVGDEPAGEAELGMEWPNGGGGVPPARDPSPRSSPIVVKQLATLIYH